MHNWNKITENSPLVKCPGSTLSGKDRSAVQCISVLPGPAVNECSFHHVDWRCQDGGGEARADRAHEVQRERVLQPPARQDTRLYRVVRYHLSNVADREPEVLGDYRFYRRLSSLTGDHESMCQQLTIQSLKPLFLVITAAHYLYYYVEL